MSTLSLGTFADMNASRATLQLTIDRLRVIASGEVFDRVCTKIQGVTKGVAASKLEKHKLSGLAAGTMKVTRIGGLIQESAETYCDFHPWWPFRSGWFPRTILAYAVKMAGAEYYAALEGQPSPMIVAEEEAEEAAAVKSRARYKADNAKIARRIFAASPAGAIARAAKAKATRAAKAGKP